MLTFFCCKVDEKIGDVKTVVLERFASFANDHSEVLTTSNIVNGFGYYECRTDVVFECGEEYHESIYC